VVWLWWFVVKKSGSGGQFFFHPQSAAHPGDRTGQSYSVPVFTLNELN
jgi:hypothetical protein